MIAPMAKGFAGLTKQRARIVEAAWALGERRLRFRGKPGEWSTLEVLDHLVRVEEATGPVLRKNLPGSQRVTAVERMGAVGVLAVMRSPIRIKVPPGASGMNPVEPAALGDVLERWERARDELREVLEGVRRSRWRLGCSNIR